MKSQELNCQWLYWQTGNEYIASICSLIGGWLPAFLDFTNLMIVRKFYVLINILRKTSIDHLLILDNTFSLHSFLLYVFIKICLDILF